MIRRARLADIGALVAIENRSFATDRVSRRAFRYLLSKAKAVTVVETDAPGRVRGYAMVLFSRVSSVARLYSIAVDPDFRGHGVGAALLEAAEAAARRRDAAVMRLEVRSDDATTQTFYERAGYRRFGAYTHYYEDDVDAVRMQKSLAPRPDPSLIRVPYYAQSLEFTCGPAALLMAMHALDGSTAMDQTAELRLWRESTTVFMTAGPGGCSPHGLALAAWRRGFAVELYLSQRDSLFVDSVRSERKKNVIRLVQADFEAQLAATDVRVIHRPLSIAVLRERFAAGGIPVVLVSSYLLDSIKAPHWVVVTGIDSGYVYLHDPDVDPPDTDREDPRTLMDCMQIPISLKDFGRMARYGRAQQKAALVISKR